MASGTETFKNYIAYLLLVVLAVIGLGYIVFQKPSPLYAFLFLSVSFISLITLLNYDYLKLDLPQNLSIEAVRDQMGGKTEDPFDRIVEIAGEESSRAANLLKLIQTQNPTRRNLDELSNVLESGLEVQETNPLQWVLGQTRVRIHELKYKNQFKDSTMKVVKFDGDRLHTKSESRGQYLKENMRFSIQLEELSASGEELEEVTPQIGIAEVVLASRRTTEMRIVEWTVSTDKEKIRDLMDNDLQGKKVFVDILTADRVENDNREELEEVKKGLEELVYNNEY